MFIQIIIKFKINLNDTFYQALPDDKDSRQLVTYKLVLRLARYYLQPISMQQDISEFQIALQLIPPFEIETAALAAESTILTSPAIAW